MYLVRTAYEKSDKYGSFAARIAMESPDSDGLRLKSKQKNPLHRERTCNEEPDVPSISDGTAAPVIIIRTKYLTY